MLFVITVILALLAGTSIEAELPSIIEIIDEEGQFAFTDGSSTYLLLDDGSFYLEPTGLSGRAVEGNWTNSDSNRFEITGIWGWYNGISSIDDKRRMTIFIYLRSMETEVSELLWRSADSKLYDVYFTIEEITKIE
ncbi:MAG: hypothetical protein KAR40_17070 [Candidatus Sabulitectum sp.]|nr:hypothetical protein [Candidatus Sabulitectum sp.]